MRKILTMIFAFMLVLSLLSGCGKKPVVPDDDDDDDPIPTEFTAKVIGNTSGNLMNGGQYAEADGWVYCSCETFDESTLTIKTGLFKMKSDGTNMTKLADGEHKSINVVGENIYTLTDEGVYTVKTDGTSGHIISGIPADRYGMILVLDETIVYLNVNGQIYRNSVDGKNPQKIANVNAYGFFYHDGWLYYGINDASYTIQKVKMDGSSTTGVSTGGRDFVFANNRIYYRNMMDKANVYSMAMDGSDRKKISDVDVNSINTDGQKLIVSSFTGVRALNFDGNGDNVLSDKVSVTLSVVGRFAYFASQDFLPQSYRLSLSTGTLENIMQVRLIDPETESILGSGVSDPSLVRVGEWIIYRDGSEANKGIYKVKTDASGKTRLIDVYAHNLTVVGDWVYFINDSLNGYLCRMKLDGSEKGVVLDVTVNDFVMKEGWIYYTDLNEIKIMKVKSDGTQRSVIDDSDSFGEIQLHSDFIYYQKIGFEAGNFGIYRTSLEGSDKLMYLDESINSYVVDTQWIYYTTKKGENELPMQIVRMSHDGSESVVLDTFDEYLNVIGVGEDMLYYMAWNDENGSLYRMNPESGQKQLVFAMNIRSDHTVILENSLITLKSSEDGSVKVYLSDMDGSNLRTIVE
ncbi:MAG: DUF5050 domain-containing protein [Erysipelotrichaceae bacterium]